MFLALALLGAGVMLGWVAGADRDLVEAEPAITTPEDAAAGVPVHDGSGAPDVRGLDLADARQIVVDAGISAGVVSVVERPAAGQSGIVVAQDPAYGFQVDEMTLFVSVPATVPEFAGRDAEVVLDELDQLGAEVTTRSVYSPGVPVGQVAAIRPRPDTVLDGPVTVVISAEADELSLSSVTAAESSCDAGVVDPSAGEAVESMNGVDFSDLFTCYSSEEPQEQAWILKRSATRLVGDLGIPDSGGRGGQAVTVVVRGDGRELGTFTAVYGQVTPLDLDVTGVLRLSFSFRVTAGTDPNSFESIVLGIGDLRVYGDAAALADLSNE